jgi:hypothetical protein
VSHNKLATVDDLNKGGFSKSEQCSFCAEKESITHLFFECVVAKVIWGYVCEFLGFVIGVDYLSIASKWLHEKRNCDVNIVSSVTLRGIWLTRNDLVFHNQVWLDVKTVLKKILRLTLEWSITFKDLIRPKMTEDGDVVFLFYEADPRTAENYKRMKASLGGSIRHALGEKDCRGEEDERMVMVCI